MSTQPEKRLPPKGYWKCSQIKVSAALIRITLPRVFFWDSSPWYYILFHQWRTVVLSEHEAGRGWYQEYPWSPVRNKMLCVGQTWTIFPVLFSCLIRYHIKNLKIDLKIWNFGVLVNRRYRGNRRDLIVNPTGLRGAHLMHMHVNKWVPAGQHDKRSSHTFSGKPAWLCSACILLHPGQGANRRN